MKGIVPLFLLLGCCVAGSPTVAAESAPEWRVERPKGAPHTIHRGDEPV